MQLIMCAKITFAASRDRAAIVIKRPTSIHIQSTWEELTSTAEITIARNVKFFDKNRVKNVFRPGDPVAIELGYDGKFVEEFTGYIAHVSADMPIVIKCEDEMYRLKRLPVNYSSANVTLDKLLRDICPGYSIDALENVKLGGVRLPKTSVAKVLDKLEQDWNLHSYMRGKQLVCGKYYSTDSFIQPVIFHLEKNVVSNALNYRNKEDVMVKIKGSSILINGKKLEYEFGEDGGDQLNLTYYNIQLKAELQRLVTIDYEKRKQDGFDGTITAFGVPSVRHGLKAMLVSALYPDRAGTYYIKGVEKTWGPDGYRQIIKLGDKAA